MYRDSRFPFYLRRSFYIHCALGALTLVGGKIVITEQLKLRNENLKLIRASVRVDMVAMPTQTLEELKAMTPENQATLEPAKVETKAEVKEEVKEVAKAAPKNDVQEIAKAEADKRQDFLAKLKKLSGKKITKAKTQTPSAEDQQLKKLVEAGKVLAGNKLSKGTEAYGDRNNEELTFFDAYKARVAQKVKREWRLPDYLLKNKELKCVVRVWTDMSGYVTKTEIYRTSGNPEYDQRATDAVKKVSPFPALSEEFGKRALNGEILLGFPL
jgi:TolA protein